MEEVWPTGLKKTKQRMAVWAVLLQAEKPLSAFELYGRLAQKDGFAVSTVYRILGAFEERGMLSKTTMLGDEVAIYHLRRAHHEHYAICLGCHRQVPLRGCPFEEAALQTQPGGFEVTGHKLELYGYCAACRQQKESAWKKDN